MITWELRHGDFVELCDTAPAPDVVWFDPFSAKVDTGMWSTSVVAKILARADGRATSLHTFSSSTGFRASLLKAGWWVARGSGTGQKRESTRAYSAEAVRQGLASDLLDAAWLERWERSDAQVPEDADPDEFKAAIRGHAQFAATVVIQRTT
jgi:queuine tRNA-ribosyltransferase